MPYAASAPGSTPSKRRNGATSGGTRVAGASGRRRSGTSSSIRRPGTRTQGDAFEPVKWPVRRHRAGQLVVDWIDATTRLEDALNKGVYDRPVRLVVADARGLSRENYLQKTQGYEWLCDQGVWCSAADLGQLTQRPGARQRRKVACIAWTGAWRYAPEYNFTVANGDIPTEGECASGSSARATRRSACSGNRASGRDYADFFRDEATASG